MAQYKVEVEYTIRGIVMLDAESADEAMAEVDLGDYGVESVLAENYVENSWKVLQATKLGE